MKEYHEHVSKKIPVDEELYQAHKLSYLLVREVRKKNKILHYLLQIVHAILENYEPDRHNEDINERAEAQHNWVDEVVRSEGRGVGEFSPTRINARPRPERKDPSQLSRLVLFRSYAMPFHKICCHTFVNPVDLFTSLYAININAHLS